MHHRSRMGRGEWFGLLDIGPGRLLPISTSWSGPAGDPLKADIWQLMIKSGKSLRAMSPWLQALNVLTGIIIFLVRTSAEAQVSISLTDNFRQSNSPTAAWEARLPFAY